MKLLRLGNVGKEIPAAIDKNGKFRNLSSHMKDLDPETIYFLNKMLNKLELKKIRNNILSEALPVRT